MKSPYFFGEKTDFRVREGKIQDEDGTQSKEVFFKKMGACQI